MQRMMECVDGEYQTFKSKDGAYVREYFFNTPELKALVADWSDEDIWNLNRGGHDPHKVYAAFHAAVNHKGQPTVILAKTIKGFGMGRIGRGAEHHAPAEENVGRVDAGVPRSLRDSGPRRQARRRSAGHLRRRLARVGIHALAPPGAGWLPAGATPRKAESLADAAADDFRALPQEHRGSRDLDDDGVRADPADADARQDHRQAHRPDRPRRIAHLRHGGHVPAARHLEPARPAVHAAGRRPADVLQGDQGRADPAGRHQRSRRHVRLDRRGDVVLDARRADDSVLHLLFDVRIPARRRSGLGGRRHALARLPARRHRRSNHAQRRGTAARGRPLAPDLGDGPQLHFLRPDVRLRGRGDRPGRPAPHGHRAGGRLLLPDGDERELHAAGDAARARSRTS